MDNKYGRLYTEADVTKLLARAVETHNLNLDDLLKECEHDLAFPADEPLFLLRGQDKAAPDAIALDPETGESGCYRESAAGWDTSTGFLSKIDQAAAEMREWQAAHPDRTKVPD